jgi:hypothetical protein
MSPQMVLEQQAKKNLLFGGFQNFFRTLKQKKLGHLSAHNIPQEVLHHHA